MQKNYIEYKFKIKNKLTFEKLGKMAFNFKTCVESLG